MWKCKTCAKQFSAKVGTIFEDSPIGLNKWLPAMWLIVNCKNGISSYELARALGVTQKTAWFMLPPIAPGDAVRRPSGKFAGEIEVDETYIGGKARNMHVGKREAHRMTQGSNIAGKVAVMGLLERRHGGSQIQLHVVAENAETLGGCMPIVRANVQSGSTVYSDSLHSYTSLQGQYIHKVIDHAEAYVDGQIHTNGLENFWSLLKRSIRGTYVSVEPFHLFRYLDEQAFRFNNRKLTDAQRFVLAAASIFGRRLTYAGVTGHAVSPSN